MVTRNYGELWVGSCGERHLYWITLEQPRAVYQQDRLRQSTLEKLPICDYAEVKRPLEKLPICDYHKQMMK